MHFRPWPIAVFLVFLSVVGASAPAMCGQQQSKRVRPSGHGGIGPHILGAWDFHFASRKEPPCRRGTRLIIDQHGKDQGMRVEFKDLRLKRLPATQDTVASKPEERVSVGLQKQLMVDDYIIAEKENVTRELGKVTKCGIVLEPTLPTDFVPPGNPVTGRAADCFDQILWDPIVQKYRLTCRTDMAGSGGTKEYRSTRIMVHDNGNDLRKYPTAWKTIADKIVVDDPKKEKNPWGNPRLQFNWMTCWIYYGGASERHYSIGRDMMIGLVKLRLKPAWKNDEDLSTLNGKVVRIRFRLRNALLYAFQIQ